MASATLDSPSGPPMKRRRSSLMRRCERSCWAVVTRLPLAIVYGLTTWAAYVAADLCIRWITVSWQGAVSLALVAALYLLLNWSYTASVFTEPGSPSSPPSAGPSTAGYSHLPLHEPESQSELPVFTVKASGGIRFCKKCQTKKPDRAHHCSTCNACRLKMDHHCPWLATCVGLRNYKPFILFCAYTTLFCLACFVISAAFLWSELGTEAFVSGGGLMGVNVVLLAVLSGIIGVVLTGFTGWHFSLAVRNQTTIECLEKTRYLSPLRRNMQRLSRQSHRSGEDSANLLQHYGQQLTEIHANALPGITRPEEGEERPSPSLDGVSQQTAPLSATESLRQNYADLEQQRERERYENYLDEKVSEKLPHAFDLGWRRNLRAVFGPNPWLWALPVTNSLGDGWHWEPSARWLAARDRIHQERERERREQERREQIAGWGPPHPAADARQAGAFDNEDAEHRYITTSEGVEAFPVPGRRSRSKANQILGRSSGQYADEGFDERFIRPGSGMSLQTLKPSGAEADDTASLDGLYPDDDQHGGDDSSSSDHLRSRQRWKP